MESIDQAVKDFKVTTVDFDGKKTSEIVSAETEAEANQIMANRGKFVTDISIPKKRVKFRKKKLKAKDMIAFSEQMGTMLKAGITTDKALSLVREKAMDAKLKKLYGTIYEAVQKGQSVSEGLEATNAFPNLYINMVKSGETAGDISGTLATLSTFYKKESEQKRMIKSAMIYPILLGVLTTLITLGLVVFVLPGITESFSEDQLPALTSALMSVSNFIISYWYIVAGALFAVVAAIIRILRIDEVILAIDKYKMKMPVIGKILTVIYSARAANTISSLYKVGASTLVIVDETGGTIGNRYIEELFDDIYIKVSTGESLSVAMEETHVFDPMLTSMIRMGEEAGDLEKVLDSVSEDFDRDSTAAIEQLISMLTPLMIVIMGIVVGTIAVAIMLPLMKMGETL